MEALIALIVDPLLPTLDEDKSVTAKAAAITSTTKIVPAKSSVTSGGSISAASAARKAAFSQAQGDLSNLPTANGTLKRDVWYFEEGGVVF